MIGKDTGVTTLQLKHIYAYRAIALIVMCIFLYPSQSKASHLYGADLYYTHVSGNTYTITLNVYGDCGGSAFPNLPTSVPEVQVFNNTTLFTTLSLLIQSPSAGVEVTPVCASQVGNTKCSNVSNVLPGVKKFVYTRNVTLNTTSTNWRFRFTGNMGTTSSAGRSGSITNISGSGTTVMNLEATLNNSTTSNSSAVYTTIPTPFFCINKAASYNPGTVDVNGDSLVYSLVPGLTATGTVTYLTGYSATAPLAVATGSFNFSTQTGQLNLTPNLVQQSLVVTSVSEYRNGVLVGTSMREMTFVVLNNCNNNPPGGKITNNNAGKVDTSGTIINVCRSSGVLNFNINPTDLDTDVINVTYSGLPVGATFTIANNNTTTPTGSFSWNVSGITPGSYNFFITYVDDGCPLSSKQTMAYTVNVLPTPAVVVAITSPATCAKKAIFTMTPSGSPSPWRLQVFQGVTQIHSFTGVTGTQTDSLSPGTYTIRATNADTCFKDTTIVIAPPPAINIALAVTPPKCNNDTNGVVVVTASGGKPTFTYAIDAGAYGTPNTFNNLGGGYHTFKIKDQNECLKDSLVLIPNPLKVGADVAFLQPPCNYYNSGVITITGKNTKSPYLYSFNASPFSATNVFSGLYSGSYPVKVKDSNNCILDTTVVLPDSIKVHANTILTHILCNADSTGVITLNAFGATAPYRYQKTGGLLTPVNTFPGLKATTHTFHIEDTNKCYLDTSIVLNQPAKITSTSAVTNVLCYGDTSGGVTIIPGGGVSPYTYAIGTGLYSTANNFSPLSSGTYTLHIKDANNCIRDTNIIVTEPTELKFSNLQITHPKCYGALSGQVIITGSGGVSSYTYAIGTSAFSTTNTFGGLGAGVHTFHIKDNNNCVKDTNVTITQPQRIIPTAAIKRSACKPLNNGSITLGASGGVPGYLYALGTGTYSSTPVFSPLVSGTYIMHVKDANNCILDTSIVVADSFTVFAGISVINALCYDSSSGIVTVSGGGGVNPYTYALGTGSYGSANVFGGLKANTYTFRIKDNIGCTKDTTATVNEPTRVVPSLVITEPSCNGYSDGIIVIISSGGTPGYDYTYNNGPFIPNNTFGGLMAATYVVSTIDINGCRRDTTVTLNEPPGMKFSLGLTNLRCYGDSSGSVLIDGTGGTPPFMYGYDLSPFVSNPVLVTMGAGQHTVKMRDNNGCLKDSIIFLTEPAKLLVTNPVITHPTCEGFTDGAAKVYGNGGVQPYVFAANGGVLSPANLFTGLKEGPNVVRVKDANGCTYDTTLMLIGYPHIIYDDIISDPVSCFQGEDGKITLVVSGGIPPLVYKIGNEASGQVNIFEGLKANTYKFRVTDSAGCIKDTSFVVESPEKMVIETKITPNDCRGMDNGGIIEAYVSGATPGFKYTWNTNPEQYGYNIKDMPNGTYKVVVTDANDCKDSTSAVIYYDNCCIIFVPDAFSPNNDGLNDLVRVRVKGDFELETFSIYNRFGQRVFETNDINKGWDGIYNATSQDIATYNYFVKGICGNAGKEEVMQKGTITLIR